MKRSRRRLAAPLLKKLPHVANSAVTCEWSSSGVSR